MAQEECNKCLPLSCLVKVDVGVEAVIDENEFNCLAILTSIPDGGVGQAPSVVNTTDCVKTYFTMSGVAEDWDSSTEVYQDAQHAFGQTPSVTAVKVMYFDPAGDIAGQLDALYRCEDCQGLLAPEVKDDIATVLAIADWVEAQGGDIFFFTDTNDENTLDPTDGTSVAALIQAAGYQYTSAYYHCDEDEHFAAAALSFGLGQDLDDVDSAFTMAFQELNLVNPCFISKEDLVAITGFLPNVGCGEEYGYFANVYTCVGGQNMMLYGAMGDGNFFDTALLREYMKARIAESLGQVLINGSAPLTDAGVMSLVARVNFTLSSFVTAGLIDDFFVEIPTIDSLSSSDRACRVLSCINFEARMAGRVHSTCVLGTLNF